MSFLPLLGETTPPALTGIARIASESDAVGQGHNVEYLTLDARSILNRCSSPRMPFAWTINPYRGCEFACKYCYARYTHEFMELRDGLDFERKIYVKQHVAALLRRDLRRVKAGEGIAIGSATDPYQPAERKYGATRAILEELAIHAGLDISIISKSNLILRDRELLARLSQRHDFSITITVTTVDTDLARILEPRAPRPDLRLEAVRALRDAGLDVGVMCAPIVPGITDDPDGLDALVAAAAAAGASRVHGNPLFLKPCSAQVFLPFLEQSFPHLVDRYRRHYADRAFVPAAYRRHVGQLLSRLRRKHRVTVGSEAEAEPMVERVEQPSLF